MDARGLLEVGDEVLTVLGGLDAREHHLGALSKYRFSLIGGGGGVSECTDAPRVNVQDRHKSSRSDGPTPLRPLIFFQPTPEQSTAAGFSAHNQPIFPSAHDSTTQPILQSLHENGP